jgi:hypothetical protein
MQEAEKDETWTREALQALGHEPDEDEEPDEEDIDSLFSTPRTMLQAEIFASKADSFLRAGRTEAAARECCKGLGEVKHDEHLERLFRDAVGRITTNVCSIDDCSVFIDLDLEKPDFIIGEALALTVNVQYRFDSARVPENCWLGLYAKPDAMRKLLRAPDEVSCLSSCTCS